MAEETTQLNSKDHDLLIRLDEKVGLMATDVREIKNGTEKRLYHIESTKLDKEDFQAFKNFLATETAKAEAARASEDAAYKKNTAEQIEKFDKRLGSVERFMYTALGVVGVIQVAMPFIMKYLFNV